LSSLSDRTDYFLGDLADELCPILDGAHQTFILRFSSGLSTGGFGDLDGIA
jgi:hypothetical protein